MLGYADAEEVSMAGAVTLKLLLLSSSPKNLSSKTYPAGYNVAAFQSIVATVLRI
jgi:hypothetical protein